MDYKIHWTHESLLNLEEILDYLNNRWTPREVNNFKVKLSNHLRLIVNNPIMFPVSQYNVRLRKAVLSKQTTIFYEVKDNVIYIVYLFVNRKNINKIQK